MYEGLDFTWLFWAVPLGIVIMLFTGLIIKLVDNKSIKVNDLTPTYSKEKTTTKTEDKVTKVSMDNFKTKEDHPMGDKTHE